MRLLIAFVVWCISVSGLAETEQTPPECRPGADERVNWSACASATRADTGLHLLALINLGTEALEQQDYAGAVGYYDMARPAGGQRLYSDARFHANRAEAYLHVGRKEEALADARTAWAIVIRDPSLPAEYRAHFDPASIDVEGVYGFILPILKEGRDPAFPRALAAFRALPARDWISNVNRAGVLEQLDDLNGALSANALALRERPNEPAALNNQRFILTRMGRAGDAMPFCERAVATAPDVAAVRHSLASALAATGQCSRADRELAEARQLDSVATTYREPIPCRPAQ